MTLEIRVSRTQQVSAQGLGNPIQAEEECTGILPGDIPCVPSEGNGNHSHSPSSSSSACAPTSDNEARPNFDIGLFDRDAMIDDFCTELTKEQLIEANEIYELLLTLGADMSVARTTVAGLLSPQIFGASVQHVSRNAGLEFSWVWEDVGSTQCG